LIQGHHTKKEGKEVKKEKKRKEKNKNSDLENM